MGQVRTPLVAFSDDDTRWDTHSLERAQTLFRDHPQLGVLNARVVVGNARRPDPTCELMRISPLKGIEGVGPGLIGFMAGACVMRTAVYRQAGGYWEPFFIGGEEALLAIDILELGWKIVYAPELVTYHYPSLRRNAQQRRNLLARNAVWTAWMRWPVAMAWQTTWHEVRKKNDLYGKLRLMLDVAQGVPRVLRYRRVVSERVCTSKRVVERHTRQQSFYPGDL